MNRHANLRPAWVKWGLLVALMGCGGAGGLYLSGAWPREGPNPPAANRDGRGAIASIHRFPLSPRDAGDTIEAPELAADSAGRIFLTWASKTGDGERTLFLTRSTDGGATFDTPRALSKGGVFKSRGKGKKDGHERRASPHLAAAGNALFLTWSEADADGVSLRLLLARSTDAGATFDSPMPVHHAPDANPTFTALAVGPGGELACAWLGGNAGQQPFAAVRRAGAGEFEQERPVHAGPDEKGVCPCCPVAACFAPDKTLYVAFRDLRDGYRDIAIGMRKPGQEQFDGPFPVTPPTWKFNGCPHDGPSLAILGDRLHVVWMDARSGAQRCYHGQAKLTDLTFTAEALPALSVGTQGNAKLHADAAGQLHAVWEESAAAPAPEEPGKHQHAPPVPRPGAGGRAIQHAILGADGRFGSPRPLAPRPGAFQTRPVILVTPAGRVVTAWNELDETGKVIVVRTVNAEGGQP